MAQCRQGNAFDVVRRDEGAAVEQGRATRGANQRDAAAGTGATGKTVMVARRANNGHGVVEHAIIDIDECACRLQRFDVLCIDQGADFVDRQLGPGIEVGDATGECCFVLRCRAGN